MRRLRLIAVAATALALALALPPAAAADHSWNGWHWARTSATETRALTVSDGVSGDWNTLLTPVLGNWNTALGGRLSLSQVPPTKKASITAQSRSFGNNGWLGLAQVWLKGTHITRAAVKLNDFYFAAVPEINTTAAKQQVFCQEVGHTLGLGHQDADSCMNDVNDLATSPFPEPNAHDAQQLAGIYDHADGSTRRGKRERGPFAVGVFRVPGG